MPQLSHTQFDYWHDGSKFWSLENLRKLRFTERPYDDQEWGHKPASDDVLNYPSSIDGLYAVQDDPQVESADEVVNRMSAPYLTRGITR